MNTMDHILLVAAFLILLSVIASKASGRFGVPALLVFLLLGMGAGPYALSVIHFTDIAATQGLGIVALIFILFSGGLGTDLKEVRATAGSALLLSTVGVAIVSCLVGFFAKHFLGLSLLEGLLLGATVASTDVAAVFTVLRSKNVSLKGFLRPLLELESALNDPMSVFLCVGLLELLTQKQASLLFLLSQFFKQMLVGSALGWFCGKILVFSINRIKLEYDGLYPVFTLGGALLVYAIAQWLGGSGFIAVYVAGIVLGNEVLLHKRSLVHFQDGLAWLMQIAMFLAMGLLVNPKEIVEVAPKGLALAAFLIFVARPASIFLCLPGKKFAVREKLILAWGGLRGAVPIILATYPLIAQIPPAHELFNLVFFVVFTSVLLQGPTIPLFARWLKVGLPYQRKYRFPLEFHPTQDLKSRLVEISVATGAEAVGKSLLDLHFPAGTLVVLILRQGATLVPRGGTHLEKNDTLLVMGESTSLGKVREILEKPRA